VDPFPNGVAPYLLGGLLIGVGVSVVYLTTGLVAGASSFFSTTWSWVSRRADFQQPDYLGSRVWRVVFTAGLVGGALLYLFTVAEGRAFHTEVPVWRLVAGGFLVGLGTRVSRGCTSGHGVCGLSAFSRASLVAVVTFMGVGLAAAAALRALGIEP
jgi:uncharacterized membrane protein YedE/YeeE